VALIAAAQGDQERSLLYLSRALQLGWLPDGRRQAVDLAQEPAYQGMVSNPRFQRLRTRILSHLERERAEATSEAVQL